MSILARARVLAGDATRWAAGMRTGSWWSELASPIPRAARFYARTWSRWLTPQRRFSELPRLRPHPLVLGEAAIDELLLAAFKVGRPPRHDDAYWRIVEEASEAVTVLTAAGYRSDPGSYWRTPPALTEPEVRARPGGVGYSQLSWESGYEPEPGLPGRDRWSGYEANHTAHAWLLRHDEPRPWLVCMPGTGMGFPRADFTVFDPTWLHHRLGCNVVVPVAPLHGPRRRQAIFGLGFPTDDLLDTVFGVTQATWDVRRLLGWIRAQDDQPIGMTGISLGAYLTAVVANLDDDLACVIAGVPPVDFAALFAAHTPHAVQDTPLWKSVHGVSADLFSVVSPLALPPRTPRDRRYIYAGLADRLVSPERQALRLWDHWQRPRIAWYGGCHMGFLWAPPVRAFVEDALAEAGLADPELVARGRTDAA